MTHNSIYLFDIDGTLTKPRTVIEPYMKNFLINLNKHVKIGLVGGSDLVKISEQLACSSEELKVMFDYTFTENGLVSFKKTETGYIELSNANIHEHLGEDLLQKVINFCLSYIASLKLPAKRGTFIEYRRGMLNVCPVGRSCSQSERNEFAEFDKINGIRSKMVELLKNEFSNDNLCFSIGGQISIDIFPIGWDKTFSLQFLKNDGFRHIFFFGDKTSPGGNDYEIFSHSLTKGFTVTSPEDTKAKLEELLSL